MNSSLNPHNNGPSLTGVIDVAAHSISLFQENEPLKNTIDIFIPKSDISIESGNNVISMYQFIGDINVTKVGGLESLLNYMTENYLTKDDPAINEHHYHIIKNNTMNIYIHNIYNIAERKTFNTKTHRFLAEPYSYNNKV